MPPEIYAEVQDSLKNWRALGYFARTDREMIFRERGVKQFTEAGAVIGMGTDSGTPMNFHSEALWREAKVHVDMGMPPIKVISSLTRIGANILGKQRDLGNHRARQARRHHRRERQSALRHHRACARGSRRQGRQGPTSKPRIANSRIAKHRGQHV